MNNMNMNNMNINNPPRPNTASFGAFPGFAGLGPTRAPGPFARPNTMGGVPGIPGPFQVPSASGVQITNAQPLPMPPQQAPGPFARAPGVPAPLVSFPKVG